MEVTTKKSLPTKNSFAKASLIMGIVCIITTIICTVYLPFIFGGLAIIFAILSKGNQKYMDSSATAGIITSAIGMILDTIIITVFCYMLFTNQSFRTNANEITKSVYGATLDEMFEQSTGFTLPGSVEE